MKLNKSDLKYVAKKITITKKNIDKLVTPKWGRQIYNPNVKRIFSDLKKGIGLHSVFALNEVNRHYLLIDGNHRKEAIKKGFKEKIFDSIEIRVHIYKKLSDEKCREIWNIYETKKTQNKSDKYKLYSDEIPVLKKLLKNKNYKIYFNSNSGLGVYPIIRFLESYVNKDTNFRGYGCDVVINKAKKLSIITDYIKIEQFISDYTKAFEKPCGKDNIFYMTTPMYILSKIYFYAKEKMNMSRDKIVEKFKRIKNHTHLYQYMKMGGIGVCDSSYKQFVDVFNSKLRKKMPYFLENVSV